MTPCSNPSKCHVQCHFRFMIITWFLQFRRVLLINIGKIPIALSCLEEMEYFRHLICEFVIIFSKTIPLVPNFSRHRMVFLLQKSSG